MNNSTDDAIKARFFEAVNMLIAMRVIRGKKTFCNDHDINRGTFYYVEKGRYEFSNPSWLTFLVNDYKVSATWLLTGRGKMFRAQ